MKRPICYAVDCKQSTSERFANCAFSGRTPEIAPIAHHNALYANRTQIKLFHYRPYFKKDRSLLNILFETAAETIEYRLYVTNKSEKYVPGMISTLHTFGRDLK